MPQGQCETRPRIEWLRPQLRVSKPLLAPLPRGSPLLAFNDNWKDTQQAEITSTDLAPTNDKESAIVGTLAPGNYTAIVRGKDNTIGVALVEVYGLK